MMLRRLLCYLFFILTIRYEATGMRILAITAHDSGSHFFSMLQLLKELTSAGHEVHVLNTVFEDKKAAEIGGLKAIHTYIPVESRKNTEVKWSGSMKVTDFLNLYKLRDHSFGRLLDLYPNKLNEIMNEVHYDLIIVDELFTNHGYAIALRLKAKRGTPWISYSTSGIMNSANVEIRSMDLFAFKIIAIKHLFKSFCRNPVIKSFMFPSPPRSSNDYYQATIFRYRLASFVDTLYEIVGFHWLVTMPNIARFGVVDFSWHKLFKDASVTFSDSLERLGWPVAEGTDLINTGAYCKLSEVLTGELKEFVEDPKSNGTIYVAFGTYADWSYAPKHILTAFANGLQHFSEYRVIFSFNGDLSIMPKVSFIKFVKWAPQAAILNHPRTKVFISHGGLKSLKESICSRTPIIIMPLFAEQAHNAHMFLALKLGRTLNKFTVDEYDVQYEVNKILQNPYYQQKIEKTREIMLDRPKDALDMALFYAERIVRTRAPNNRIVFQRKGMDLYWFEYLYSEFVLLLVSVVLLIK